MDHKSPLAQSLLPREEFWVPAFWAFFYSFTVMEFGFFVIHIVFQCVFFPLTTILEIFPQQYMCWSLGTPPQFFDTTGTTLCKD